MAKKQDFLSKTKRFEKHGLICQTCGDTISHVQVVRTEKSAKTDAWRFNQNFVAVCKCNEKEVYA